MPCHFQLPPGANGNTGHCGRDQSWSVDCGESLLLLCMLRMDVCGNYVWFITYAYIMLHGKLLQGEANSTRACPLPHKNVYGDIIIIN